MAAAHAKAADPDAEIAARACPDGLEQNSVRAELGGFLFNFANGLLHLFAISERPGRPALRIDDRDSLVMTRRGVIDANFVRTNSRPGLSDHDGVGRAATAEQQ